MEHLEDDRIENTRNRVFINNIAVGKNSKNSMATVSTSVYRVIGRKTGTGQINDILECGYVRPRLTFPTNKHHNQLFWTQGGKNTFYMKGKFIVLEAPENIVKNNQIGAIPFEDLIGIWKFNEDENKYVNYINYYKKIYKELHQNNSLKSKNEKIR